MSPFRWTLLTHLAYAKAIQWGKIVLSIYGTGTTGQLHAKDDVRPLPHTIHKNQLKMKYRPKRKR